MTFCCSENGGRTVEAAVNKPSPIPQGFSWRALLKLDGDDLEIHYRHTLEDSASGRACLASSFRKAQNKTQDPAKLRRLIVDLIDKPGPGPADTWSSLSADVKGDAYEGLLQKNAEDVKGGAGQYFIPSRYRRDGGRDRSATRVWSRTGSDDLRSGLRY